MVQIIASNVLSVTGLSVSGELPEVDMRINSSENGFSSAENVRLSGISRRSVMAFQREAERAVKFELKKKKEKKSES